MTQANSVSTLCGQIWYVQGGGDYTSRGRPGVVLQRNEFSSLDSITVCLFTTNADSQHAPLIRRTVEPTARNGLDRRSWLMLDKLVTVRRARLRMCIGELDETNLESLADEIPALLTCGGREMGFLRRLRRFLSPSH